MKAKNYKLKYIPTEKQLIAAGAKMDEEPKK